MSVRHFILGTAGHVDHGKSAIVRALTGIDPDRLPEEKARGMTIDLGFASFTPSPGLSIGVVDVPGHEDFVRNMVAGVGAINAAMLVVAADDGWMPQSEEHLRILAFLNIRHGLIALTKIDRVDENGIQEVVADIRSRVRGTFLAEASIVPISIPTQRGLRELNGEIVRLFDRVPLPADIGKPRLQVDRSFVMRGTGRVVTGTLTGGELAGKRITGGKPAAETSASGSLPHGEFVTLSPAQKNVTVRAIQTHGHDIAVGLPGMRVALNIPELGSDQEWRGQTVTLQSLSAVHDSLDVRLLRLAADRPIRRGATLHVHHGTQVVEARIFPFGDPGLAQLRLQSPLPVFVGDRMVLRDAADLATLGGVIVLDPSARRSGMTSPKRQQFLNRCAESIDDVQNIVEATVEFAGITRQTELLVQSNFSAAAIDDAVHSSKTLIARSGFVLTIERWNDLLRRLAEQIRFHHHDHPEQAGLNVSMLRPVAGPLLDAAIESLIADGFQKTQSLIRELHHRPALPPRLLPAGTRLRTVFEQRALDPPPRLELTPDAVSQQALAFLKINGEVIELSSTVFISAAAFTTARQQVIDFLRINGRATVTELKSAMGASRRVGVPLLEHLDRMGVTRRSGDLRELRST